MAMANQSNMDREFEPGCWRYVTVRDFRNQMMEEAFTQSGLRGFAEDTIVAKLQWSRQACNIMHGQWSFHGTPYQIPESQQKVASPDWESDDSEATIAYGGETEEDTSTSSITSTCGEDGSEPDDVEEESDDDGDELEPVYYPVELGG